MLLEIMTPDKMLFSGEVSLVQLPGKDGSFEVLKDHAHMIAALKKGRAKAQIDGEDRFFDLQGGIVEVRANKVVVLSE